MSLHKPIKQAMKAQEQKNTQITHHQTNITSLEKALSTNQSLQNEITSKLNQVSKLKYQNRLQAAQAIQFLKHSWESIDQNKSAPEPKTRPFWRDFALAIEQERNNGNDSVRMKRKRGRGSLSDRVNYISLKNEWEYDPDRKWKERFFVDPYDVSPSFPCTLNSIVPKPWSKKECYLLKDTVDTIRKEQENTKATIESNVSDSMIDYTKVSKRLKTRSALECRNKYLYSLSPNINHKKWTKEESLNLLKHVHTSSENNEHPKWDEIALSFQNRTPWQCFTHYHTNLNNQNTNTIWTKYENELLLKYIAYKGPTYLIDKGNCDEMCRNFFQGRSIVQVLTHAHSSLVNPNIDHEVWGEEEERKLVLCMKIYKNAPSPILKAAMHYTNRSPKSVSDKWNRCLNPQYDTSPFKPEEDEELLSAVAAAQTTNWAEISRNVLSNRSPAMISRRWMDIAPEGEVLERYRNTVKVKQGVKKRMVIGDGLLCPDDFVVRVKKDP